MTVDEWTQGEVDHPAGGSPASTTNSWLCAQ